MPSGIERGFGAPAQAGGTQKTVLQAVSGILKWPTLIWAAIGVLSTLDDLLPALRRLSLIMEALTGAYRFSREWLYDQIQRWCAWVGLQIPEIPALWKDGLIILGLVFIALNFESLRRDRTPLILLLARVYFEETVLWLLGRTPARSNLIDTSPQAISVSRWGAHWIVGSVASLMLHNTGRLPWLADVADSQRWTAIAALGCALGLASYFILGLLTTLAGGRPAYRPRGAARFAARFVATFMRAVISPIFFVLLSAINGWRSIAIAALLVVGFVGVNWFCLVFLEPLLAQPPDWLTRIVETGQPDAPP